MHGSEDDNQNPFTFNLSPDDLTESTLSGFQDDSGIYHCSDEAGGLHDGNIPPPDTDCGGNCFPGNEHLPGENHPENVLGYTARLHSDNTTHLHEVTPPTENNTMMNTTDQLFHEIPGRHTGDDISFQGGIGLCGMGCLNRNCASEYTAANSDVASHDSHAYYSK